MVSLATGSRGRSVKQQTLSRLFKLDLNGITPVIYRRSHFSVKNRGLSDLRES